MVAIRTPRHDEMVLTGDRREIGRYLAASATLAAIGVWAGVAGSSAGWLTALLFGGLSGQFARMFSAGPQRLLLSAEGFRVEKQLVRWDNVAPRFTVEDTLPLLTFAPFGHLATEWRTP